nr:IS30 family transposase [Xanthomonas oryzae]
MRSLRLHADTWPDSVLEANERAVDMCKYILTADVNSTNLNQVRQVFLQRSDSRLRWGLLMASKALGQHKPTRGLRRTTAAKRTWVPEELRIVHRPEEVAQRLIPGHWEGDLIKGAFNRSCVGTLVERKTRFVVLCKMDGCTAQHALEGFTRQMKKLPHFLLGSLTYGRGTEMTCYPELMKRLNIDLWFADPHAPWQRGSNENTNGLLRQFMPKGADLSKASQAYLNNVADLMNARPRQTLGWKTPNQALEEEIAQFNSRVALAS